MRVFVFVLFCNLLLPFVLFWSVFKTKRKTWWEAVFCFENVFCPKRSQNEKHRVSPALFNSSPTGVNKNPERTQPFSKHVASKPMTSQYKRTCWKTRSAQSAAPGSREVWTGSAWRPTPLGLPGAHESGDNFADRSPPGMVRSYVNPPRTSLSWTPQQP